MILIQGVLEWAVVRRSAGLLVVGIRIIKIVLVTVALLLAIDTPDCNGDTPKQDRTTNAADHTTDYTLGRTAEA